MDDIYFLEAKFYSLIGRVRELSTEQPIIPNTLITVFNGNGDVIDTVTSDKNGMFRLDLPFDQEFVFKGEKEGYEALEGLKFSTKGKPFGVDSLMLPLWKHKLFAKGKIYSNETQSQLQGATVVLKNLTDGTADSTVIGDNGSYSFVAIPNKLYEMEVKKDGFIPNGFKLNTKDLLEGELLNDVVLEETYIEKDIILFEYNAMKLSQTYTTQLDKILRTLKKHSNSTVFIGAHADSRGSVQYNLQLSTKRANAIADYLVQHGVAKSRIEAVGFGEELILNQCSSGVECSDADHSQNRRAEVKIQGIK
jgi:outer membrane protein OmpA-like peptidoglycan-associated protein